MTPEAAEATLLPAEAAAAVIPGVAAVVLHPVAGHLQVVVLLREAVALPATAVEGSHGLLNLKLINI